MKMASPTQTLSVTEATRRGVAGLVADAEAGEDLMVTRRQVPVAAILGVNRLADLDNLREDLLDLALVLVRAATDSGKRTAFDDVLTAFGHTPESLAALLEDPT